MEHWVVSGSVALLKASMKFESGEEGLVGVMDGDWLGKQRRGKTR